MRIHTKKSSQTAKEQNVKQILRAYALQLSQNRIYYVINYILYILDVRFELKSVKKNYNYR